MNFVNICLILVSVYVYELLLKQTLGAQTRKIWRSPHSCGIGCLAYSLANFKMNMIYDLHNISRLLHLNM